MVDALIRLFDASATSFTTNGLGSLSEAISCEVTEGLNLSENGFELSMTYPITGRLFKDISLRKIIVTKSNPFSDPQAFRIYYISKPINGIISIDAAHISYDLTGYPVSPFESEDILNALIDLKNNSVLECPFTFSTDKTTIAHLNIKKPMSIKMALGGTEGSILDTYRGEYEFNNFNVKLWNNRGSNNGVSIRYGKNLIDLEQEENCESVKTGIYPYWYSEETEELVELPEKVVNAPGTYAFQSIESYDMTDRFEEKPTVEQLRAAAQSYVNNNNIGIPKVSLTVSFVSLSQSEEYKDYALIQNVRLGDTVNVFFEKLGVNSTAKCIKTDYDVLTNRYIKIHLGDASKGIVDTIAEQMNDIVAQNQKIDSKPSMSVIEEAIDQATKLITGGLGGYVVIRSSTGGDHPDEILIMDHDNIVDSIKIWRWNKNGLGYSSTGYNGPYSTAITSNGEIVANFIKAGTLESITITGCRLTANELVGGELIDSINSDAETQLKIKADRVELDGNVIFKSNLYDGETVISGDNILTGLIRSDLIDTAGLKAEMILVTDSNGNIIFSADGEKQEVKIGGFTVTPNSFLCVDTDSAIGEVRRMEINTAKLDMSVACDGSGNIYWNGANLSAGEIQNVHYSFKANNELGYASSIKLPTTFKHGNYTQQFLDDDLLEAHASRTSGIIIDAFPIGFVDFIGGYDDLINRRYELYLDVDHIVKWRTRSSVLIPKRMYTWATYDVIEEESWNLKAVSSSYKDDYSTTWSGNVSVGLSVGTHEIVVTNDQPLFTGTYAEFLESGRTWAPKRAVYIDSSHCRIEQPIKNGGSIRVIVTEYERKLERKYSRGNNQGSDVTSYERTAYPENGKSGNTWYVLQ